MLNYLPVHLVEDPCLMCYRLNLKINNVVRPPARCLFNQCNDVHQFMALLLGLNIETLPGFKGLPISANKLSKDE